MVLCLGWPELPDSLRSKLVWTSYPVLMFSASASVAAAFGRSFLAQGSNFGASIWKARLAEVRLTIVSFSDSLDSSS